MKTVRTKPWELGVHIYR